MPDVIIPVQQSIDQNPPDDALVCFVVGPQAIGTRRWDAILAQMVALVGDGLPDIPEDGRNYTLRGRDNIGEGGQNDPITFWAIPFEVPSTPGEASGIGHVLTVFGEGDRDYRWAAQNAEAALPAIPEDGFDYTLRGRDRIGQGGSNEPIKFWARAREVPTTPGTESGIGRILTVYGTNDRDYRWESLNVTAAVDAAVDAYLQANPPTAGVDATARAAAASAQARADMAGTAAVEAQLDTDTVIEAGPPFVHNDRSARNLNINIRHPLNAYREATRLEVRVANAPPVVVAYDNTTLSQSVDAGISAVSMGNLWDQTVGRGHPDPTAQLYPVGSFVGVDIRLTGPGDQPGETIVHFVRIIDILIIAPEAAGGDVDQTARDAAAAARAVANANAAALIPPSDAEAETATATNVRGWSAAKLRRLVQAIVPAWARAANAPSAAVAGATIGSAIGTGTRTLRNNTAIRLGASTVHTVIMRNSRVLPDGARYNNDTGQLTLSVGRWLLSGIVQFTADSEGTHGGMQVSLASDVEGPTPSAVIATASIDYNAGFDATLNPSTSLTALVEVTDLGAGNDTAVITLRASANSAFWSVTAGRLDVIKLG